MASMCAIAYSAGSRNRKAFTTMADQKPDIVLVGNTAHDMLLKMVPEMQMALPRHITPERMARLCFTSIKSNPKLLKSTRESFLGAVMTACQLGLEPGVMGQCWIIPYYNSIAKAQIATFVPGWRGLLDLVKRTERASASTRGVFDGDEFDFAFGDRPFVHHRPGKHFGDEKALSHTYAVGWTNGCEYPEIDVWDIDRVWRHRNKINKVGDSHYSYAYPEQYARKVPLLQVIKYLPTSIELATAITLDGKAAEGTQLLTAGGAMSNIIDDEDVKSIEVEQLMEQLGWSDEKRQDFRQGYQGRSNDAIDYLKAEVAKVAKSQPTKGPTAKKAEKQETAQAAEESQPKQQAQPSSQAQQQQQRKANEKDEDFFS